MTDTAASLPPTPPRRLFAALWRRLPRRRTALKWLHWSILPFFVWFLFADPEAIRRLGPAAFRFHSVMGLGFVTLALVWTAEYLRRGLAGRPGPKLPPWARRLHRVLHHAIVWGLFGVALTGFLLGLTSSRLMLAGGFVPIAPPLGLPEWHDLAGRVHTAEFYLLAGIVGVHAGFHVWRHLRLRDNALRIMAPKVLHRFL